MEISSYPSKHWSSGPILMHIGFLICSFFFYKHWNYDLMPAKIGFLALFHKRWNSDLLLVCWSSGHIEIWTSSFQRLELLIIVILALFFQTLEFLSHSFTANIEILAPSFEKFEFWFYFYKHCNSHVILPNTGILALFFICIGCVILFFKRLRFWPYFCKHWNYDLIVANVGIVGLFYTH